MYIEVGQVNVIERDIIRVADDVHAVVYPADNLEIVDLPILLVGELHNGIAGPGDDRKSSGALTTGLLIAALMPHAEIFAYE
jgi:hypothetical protein